MFVCFSINNVTCLHKVELSKCIQVKLQGFVSTICEIAVEKSKPGDDNIKVTLVDSFGFELSTNLNMTKCENDTC